METVEFNGWDRNVRLSNGEVELIVTQDVGPRVIRFGFVGERNLFAELDGQQGGMGEEEWMLRGGHRLWLAPEAKPLTYELDNTPIEIERLPSGGIRTRQPAGPLSGVVKTMDIELASDENEVTIVHTLVNKGGRAILAAPWALTVMAPGGAAIVPLPGKIPHTERLTHNQAWSIWPYTDLSDPRWMFGSRYLRLRQNRKRGPTKIGMAHREGWVGYQLGEYLFVKRFEMIESAAYPDGGVNFETFTNEDFLEIESLGALTRIEPGESVSHEEQWELFRQHGSIETEDDIDKHVLPLVR
jgi:hypothetical protein